VHAKNLGTNPFGIHATHLVQENLVHPEKEQKLRMCLLPSGRREGEEKRGCFLCLFPWFSEWGEDGGEGGGFFSIFTK